MIVAASLLLLARHEWRLPREQRYSRTPLGSLYAEVHAFSRSPYRIGVYALFSRQTVPNLEVGVCARPPEVRSVLPGDCKPGRPGETRRVASRGTQRHPPPNVSISAGSRRRTATSDEKLGTRLAGKARSIKINREPMDRLNLFRPRPLDRQFQHSPGIVLRLTQAAIRVSSVTR